MKMPQGVSSWEIAGISAFPLVEAMLSLDIPAKLGWSPEQFFSVLAGLMTLMAMGRALQSNRTAKKPAE